MNFGFFNGSDRFKSDFVWKHFMPSATALGCKCPEEKDEGHFMATFFVGITVQNYHILLYLAEEQRRETRDRRQRDSPNNQGCV